MTFPPYQKEIIWEGLKLTDIQIIPHADSPNYNKEIIKKRKYHFKELGYEYILLNGADAFIIDGNKKELLKKYIHTQICFCTKSS